MTSLPSKALAVALIMCVKFACHMIYHLYYN